MTSLQVPAIKSYLKQPEAVKSLTPEMQQNHTDYF